MKQKYYVVWVVGRKTGVFDNWIECEAQIKGYDGNKYKSFNSLIEAQEAFNQPYNNIIIGKNKITVPSQQTTN